jgi:uncharacterized membrane protein YphA (DoxX/SURF4 family)
MQNPLTTNQARDTSLLLARVSLGVFFLLAGYGKVAGGVSQFVEDHLKAVPHFVSPEFGKMYLQALPWTEMLCGVALVVGFYTRIAATLVTLMLISFIIAVTGVGFQTKPPQVDKNLVFLGLSILLMTSGGGQIAVDHSMGKPAPGPGKK